MKSGSADRYSQEKIKESKKFVSEGIEGGVVYSGEVKDVLYQLVGGLKSAMGYVGGKNIIDFQNKAKFTKISSSSIKENKVHDVLITKESMNYSE